MQGQRSTTSSLPDSINFDYGSQSSNVGVDQQICWNNLRNPAESRLSDYRISSSSSDTYMDGIGPEGRSFSRWSIGESSSTNPQNQVGYDDGMTQSGWPSPLNGSVGAGLRLDEQQHEPTNFVSHTGVNLNLSSNQVVTGSSFVQSSDSDSASQNHDLNDSNIHRLGDDMDCPNASSKSIAFDSKFLPSGSSSSEPFAFSSGNGGFLVEEDEGRPGCSLDGRRLSCKRKTLEGNAGQSSSSGSCYTRAEGSVWHVVPARYDASGSDYVSISTESTPSISPPEQVNPRLGLGMNGGLPADSLHPLSVPGGPEIPYRNFRLRVNPSILPDTLPSNSLSSAPSGGAPRSDIPSAHQPLRYVPMTPPLDLMSPIPPDSSVPQSQPAILRVPALRRNVQAHRWNGAPNLRPGSSSSPVVSGEREAELPDNLNSRNMSRNSTEHPMFVPLVEARNLAQNPTNWSLSNGNVGISRDMPSSSRSGSASASHTTSGHRWGPHRHSSSQYSRRLSEYVRRSLLSTVGSEIAGQSSNSSQLRSGPASSQDGTLPSSGGNQGFHQSQIRSDFWIERQGGGAGAGAFGIPYPLRALAAAGEGRSRLVSELRNVLDIMRRGEGLRFEDVMILDQSVLFGMGDVNDQHRDMRLDVDNMSYEELLALEERIGSVCTGLSEEKILLCMKQRKYIVTMSDDQVDTEPCCICQEEYNDGEDLGTLDCGHDFHRECVKQWLAHKNLCPICKTTALAV